MKVTNKTEAYVKYADVVFAPKETKEIENDKIYIHGDFTIEEMKTKKIIKKTKKTKKKKGGKK